MVAAITTAAGAVVAAIVAYALTYLSNRRLSLWQKQLERTNAQLRDFHGPLLSLAETSNRTWKSLSKRYGHSRERIVREQNGDLWVLWITSVFQPLNNKMTHIIARHADLLIDNRMPDCLLDLFAHAAGYRVTIRRLQNNDRTEKFSISDWPKNLNKYLEISLGELKWEQQRLIGLIEKTSRRGAFSG